MRIKRTLSLLLALCLIGTLALSSGCNKSDETGKSTSSAPNPGTASLTAEEIYGGANLSEDTIAALQNSGTITMYTIYANLAKGEPNDDQKAEADFYKKYYGLTIKYKYQAYGDDLSKFLTDYANNDAPDYLDLTYRRWPKAGTRQVIYTIDELKKLGVVGLDHPEITRYDDIAAWYHIGDRYYSPGICYADPSVLAYNIDLFDEYKVKSPGEYYKEGNWTMDTYIKCCKEITRTLPNGDKIWGSYWRDHNYYLVADDVHLVDWDESGEKLVLNMTKPETIRALEVWADTYLSGYSPTPNEQQGIFDSGKMGMTVIDANNFAQKAVNFTFNWDIVPTPMGSNNTSGCVPGECKGNGVVSGTKNPQGVINYCIASSLYREARYNQPYGVYYIWTYDGVYNKDQLAMIMDYCDHIGLDLYWGVGNLCNNQYKFWNDLKGGTMTTKEVFDTYETQWQAEVDAENQAKADAEKRNAN